MLIKIVIKDKNIFSSSIITSLYARYPFVLKGINENEYDEIFDVKNILNKNKNTELITAYLDDEDKYLKALILFNNLLKKYYLFICTNKNGGDSFKLDGSDVSLNRLESQLEKKNKIISSIDNKYLQSLKECSYFNEKRRKTSILRRFSDIMQKQ